LQGRQVRPECMQVPRIASNGGVVRDPITIEIVTEEMCGTDLLDAGHYPLVKVEGTGSMSSDEYDTLVYDLANFMYYVGEPARMDRTRIGVYVLLFLAFFYVFALLLGREYEKEFHK